MNNRNEQEAWIDQLYQPDAASKAGAQNGEEEVIYTVRMKDFLEMPELNFHDLALVDRDLRALMN